MANSMDTLPIKIFVTNSKDEKLGVISDRENIKFIMDYIHKQESSFCSADYGARAYFKNDSSITYPIWISCCKELTDSLENVLLNLFSDNRVYRRYEFYLPIDNDPKHIIDILVRSGAYIYKLDTARSPSITMSATEDHIKNKQEYWNLMVNETHINKYYSNYEIELSDFRLFSANLYFSDIRKFSEAYTLIRTNGKFQIHKAIVPTMNNYGIFIENKMSILDSLLKGNDVIKVKIGS
jgi:hypothetical protein